MIIGVTGDTHNNLKNISTICSIFNENRADLVLHTGDISLPKSLLAFKDLKCPIIAVLGNNDIGEEKELRNAAREFDCEINTEPFFIKLANRNVSVVHHPELITEKMLSENDIIFHGHTHRYRLEKNKKTIIFNPGECAGILKGKNQIGIIDLSKKEIEPKILNF
ncbi:YfcE family phosphodiesterase [Gammaproteobacteria bacterium]|nr:YfcE family phosphodiesterase [Gammaproteobacteria bacterium]